MSCHAVNDAINIPLVSHFVKRFYFNKIQKLIAWFGHGQIKLLIECDRYKLELLV